MGEKEMPPTWKAEYRKMNHEINVLRVQLERLKEAVGPILEASLAGAISAPDAERLWVAWNEVCYEEQYVKERPAPERARGGNRGKPMDPARDVS